MNLQKAARFVFWLLLLSNLTHPFYPTLIHLGLSLARRIRVPQASMNAEPPNEKTRVRRSSRRPIPTLTFEGVTLAVSDIERSVEFYGDVLGFSVLFAEGTFRAELQSENGAILALFSAGVLTLFSEPQGAEDARESQIAPSLPFHLEFWVEDLDGLFEHVTSLGYHMTKPSYGPWKGRSSFLKDPDGYTPQVHG
jgi:catechol 2,3-dioxygenase-like lactoylglutathione lyase family enzyme